MSHVAVWPVVIPVSVIRVSWYSSVASSESVAVLGPSNVTTNPGKDKMKDKKFHTVRTGPKSNRKIVDREVKIMGFT